MERNILALLIAFAVGAAGCKEEKKAECGDGKKDEGEVCDGGDMGGTNCQALGFLGGTLACNPACGEFVMTLCNGGCGNDRAEGTDQGLATAEPCDGDDRRGANCNTAGFELGDVGCLDDCSALATTDCYDSVCGDDLIETPYEDCEAGIPLATTCVGLGYNAGDLACGAECEYDESGCITWVCGNSIVEGLEQCDTLEFDGETCDSLGYDAGDLACLPSTDANPCRFDVSACIEYVCGDGTVQPGEDCEPLVAITATCIDEGFASGTIGCIASGETGECEFDLVGCVNGCGNSLVEGTEVCDRTDLGGEDCTTQGFVGGDLHCLDDCTGFDTSACISA